MDELLEDELIIQAPAVDVPIQWPTGRPHFSYSELALWSDCSYRFKLVHINKLGKFIPTPHLSLGTGVHGSNENYIKTRIMDKSIAFNIIEASWKQNHELFTNGPFPDWSPKGFGTVDDWKKKASMIIDDVPAFLDKKFPGWKCYSAEELLYENVQDNKLKFKGYIDGILQTTDKKGKTLYWIIDWKTCGWGWDKKKKQNFNVLLQLILYKNFWAKKNNIPLKDVRCCFMLLKREGKPGKSIDFLPVSVGPKTIERGLKVINNYVKSVDRGLFLKNRNSCKYCEFNDTIHCPPNM